PQHLPFRDLPPEYLQPGVQEHHNFASTLQGQGQCLGPNCMELGIPDGGMFPVSMAGRVQTVALGKGPTDTTGNFPTEMVGMSLSGVGPTPPFIMIRESPTLPSLGETSITDVGGGLYHIDSFFDVFTELSLDGGATWMPNTAPSAYGPPGSTRVILGIPEPASVVLVALGALAFVGRTRRRS
ncbi:MAG: PEP-CTERM sorting domain-containing protein, partial [Pirellulales bacterium]